MCKKAGTDTAALVASKITKQKDAAVAILVGRYAIGFDGLAGWKHTRRQ